MGTAGHGDKSIESDGLALYDGHQWVLDVGLEQYIIGRLFANGAFKVIDEPTFYHWTEGSHNYPIAMDLDCARFALCPENRL